MKILLIEDDAQTAGHVAGSLRQHGHVVDHSANGRDGLFLAAGASYDVMVIDRMLPGLDGLAIVKTIRSAGIRTPVLFLTTLGGIDDRVEGLEAGATTISSSPSPSRSSSPVSTRSPAGRRWPRSRRCCASPTWKST